MLLSLVCLQASAQQKSVYRFAATLGGGFTGSINTTSSNAMVPGTGQTYKQYNDSVGSKESMRLNWGANLWFNYMLSPEWDLQTGLGYMEVGFRRSQDDIKFQDKLYPGMGTGKLIEASNTKKSIDYNYKYHFIQVPVLFNYMVKKAKSYQTTFSLTGGAAVDILVKHHIKANLDQFTVDGEKSFSFDSTGYSGSRVNMHLMIGGRLEQKLDPKTTLLVQPLFGFYPLSVSDSEIAVRPYFFMVNVGLIYSLEDLTAKK